MENQGSNHVVSKLGQFCLLQITSVHLAVNKYLAIDGWIREQTVFAQ